MINNWTEENAVLLAEWTANEYRFEEMGMIEIILQNPPVKKDRHGDDEPNWKLNPDTIRRWMSDVMEQRAATRESEHQKLKSSFNDPLPVVDYESFKKRLEAGTALREIKSDPWLKGDDAYSKFRAQRLQKEIEKEKQETLNRDGNDL